MMGQKVGRVPVSVIIPVKNEEANISACLQSVSWADEIWVVDSHSTDKTAEIAEQLGAKVVQFDYKGGFPKKKNWALKNLPFKNEWVLLLDADERVTPELQSEITHLFTQPPNHLSTYPPNHLTTQPPNHLTTYDGVYINRRLIFLGRWIRHGGWYPSWNLRLFKHRLGRFERLHTDDMPQTGDVEVHEHVILQGRAGYLKHPLIHEDFKSIYHFIERHNRYSNWDAKLYLNLLNGIGDEGSIGAKLFGTPVQRKRWLKKLWVRLPFRPALRFLWMYLVRGGFLDGYPGFIFCTLMSFHEAVINAKLYELKHRTLNTKH